MRRCPRAVRTALEDAMELAIANVPAIEGQVYVCPDVSGSMRSPITGHRKGATTAVRCVDVAALVTAAIVRRNPTAEVLPFEESVVPLRLSSRDSVMTNAERLASVGGGGTCVSAPLALLNARKAKGDLVVDRLRQRVVGRRERGVAGRQRCVEWRRVPRAQSARRGWC